MSTDVRPKEKHNIVSSAFLSTHCQLYHAREGSEGYLYCHASGFCNMVPYMSSALGERSLQPSSVRGVHNASISSISHPSLSCTKLLLEVSYARILVSRGCDLHCRTRNSQHLPYSLRELPETSRYSPNSYDLPSRHLRHRTSLLLPTLPV